MGKPWNLLYICLLAILSYRIGCTDAAFTLTTTTPIDGDVIQQNAAGTWCFYPKVRGAKDINCRGDFTTVSQVHLNTTTSIGYYAADNSRYGGPEWSISATDLRHVVLCVSGRAQDGTYKTACGSVNEDNEAIEDSSCKIAVGQSVVTDGCYEPGLPPVATGTTDKPSASGTPGLSYPNSAFHRLGKPAENFLTSADVNIISNRRGNRRKTANCHYHACYCDDWRDGEPP
jgi:hypothetical protein